MGHTGKVALKKSSTLLALGNVFAPPVPLVLSLEYQAVIDRATVLGYTKPSRNQQVLQNTLMLAMISSGAFAKADLIYVLANDGGVDFSRINWKNPSSFTLANTGVEIPKFLSNYGAYGNTEVVGVGAFGTGWTPSVHAVNFTLNNNSIIHSTYSNYGVSGFAYRMESAPVTNATLFYALDGIRSVWNNANGGDSQAGPNNNLMWMSRRTAAAVGNLCYSNGAATVASLNSIIASTGMSTSPLTILGDAATEGMFQIGHPMDSFFIGGALLDAEFVAYNNAMLAYLSAIRYSTQIFATGNYTVPAGITQLLVECWGGGGAGRGYINATAVTTGAGGGGGAYAASLVNVTPGQIIPIVVGAAGIGTTAGAGVGTGGGDTSWNGGVVLAKGGAASITGTVGGAGGLASASVGTTKYDGGRGGNGFSALNGSTGSGGSGAGALGAGLAGYDGISASGLTTRVKYNMLGPGAPGYSLSNVTDAAGIAGMLASGGGGARRATTTKAGGNGGQGYIRVSAMKSY